MAKKDYDKTLTRLITTLTLIAEGAKPNTKRLAEEFNVTVRTIQKDIKDRLSGFPIIKDSDGGFVFYEGYSLNKSSLSVDEMMFLSIALSQFDDVNNIDQITERIFTKLKSSNFNNPYYVKQDSLENIDVDSPLIERLEKYIQNREIINIKLSHRTTEIEPYKIANFDGFWYLYAKDMNDEKIKTFKFSEILSIDTTYRYHRVSQSQIETILDKTHSAFYDDGNCFEVLIKVAPEVAIYFKNREFLQSQIIEEEHEDGSLIVSFEVSHDEDIDNIIKSWLPHVEILSPIRFRDKLIKELEIYIDKIKRTDEFV